MLLEHQQAWGHDHFPEDLVTVLDRTLGEELPPNMQSELPLKKLSQSFPRVLSLDTRDKRDQHLPLCSSS